MRRREFIGLLGGVAGALTCADVFAAQKSPKARIGVLINTPTPECKSSDAFQDLNCWLPYDLNALGWREGENLQIEIRSYQGRLANLPRVAAELVALRPDVLIGAGSDETKALQAATTDVPIFFMSSSDPVGYGLVDSIAHPGKNVTGIAVAPQILWGKRLELLVDLLGHRPTKIAWLTNPESVPAKPNLAALMLSAEQRGIKVEPLEVREPSDFDRAFAATAGSEAPECWLFRSQSGGQPTSREAAKPTRLTPSRHQQAPVMRKGGVIA